MRKHIGIIMMKLRFEKGQQTSILKRQFRRETGPWLTVLTLWYFAFSGKRAVPCRPCVTPKAGGSHIGIYASPWMCDMLFLMAKVSTTIRGFGVNGNCFTGL